MTIVEQATCTRVRVTAPRTWELETAPLEDPGPGDVVVRNHATLISAGTELALFTGSHVGFADPDNHFAEYPLQLGYAAVGTVVAAGDEAPHRPGELLFHFGRHASHQRFAPTLERCRRLPAGTTPEAALLARLAQIAATAREVVCVEPRRVHVFGCGLVGILAGWWLQRSGSTVTVSDPSPLRRERARALGLEPVARAEEPDVVIEATGVPAVLPLALEQVRRRGQVIQLGAPRGPVELRTYELIMRTGVHLVGAHEMVAIGTPPGRADRASLLGEALGVLLTGELDHRALITDHVVPAAIGTAYERLERADDALGVVVDWTG